VPTNLGHIEGENGDNVNFGVSILVKKISCACGCICNNNWNNINTTKRR
jgi:hypothetical protein